ncbi:CHL4-domain-containing protein [Sporormia fimetaria CBS 119925]|uniref:CHL4-domain-containing protein n=1 Tax=Sporormia fimetaria CBS 119925 TaxID=1340428 RepID=A0A6A6V7V8_9PLEO|nr:CHL4-domain-containing protein [Sporormia fimetaria CBS 119925]
MARPAEPIPEETRAIPHSHRLPVDHRDVVRIFSKLSRASLLALTQQWLAKKNRVFCRPYLRKDAEVTDSYDPDDYYLPATTHEELQETYRQLSTRKGGRREVLNRVLLGDWRTGISMYQLGTAEIQHLLDHPTALRWTAQRIVRSSTPTPGADEVTNETDHLPRFQMQTFLSNLSADITPVMRAHYLLTRVQKLPLTILRVYMHDSPYTSELSLANNETRSTGTQKNSARAVLFIFPNGSPFVFVSLATNTGQLVDADGRRLRDHVLQAIPRALSRRNVRYALVNTSFSTKNLNALLAYRGPGKTTAAPGGYSIFSDHSLSQNALDIVATGRSSFTAQEENTKEKEKDGTGEKDLQEATQPAKRTRGRPPARRKPDAEVSNDESNKRRRIAQGRFGVSGDADDGVGIEAFRVGIRDAFPGLSNGSVSVPALVDSETGSEWRPDVRVGFRGKHVFAGIRELVERGVVDGVSMPGWMTGEVEGVGEGEGEDGVTSKRGVGRVSAFAAFLGWHQGEDGSGR